jgi:uncharacterized protein (DUF1778 family)
MVDRTRRLSMKISDEEHRMLEALAEKQGQSASDFVRQFIRRQYAAEFPEPPKKTLK